MPDFDYAEFKRKPGETVAEASVRIANKYNVERQTARNWVTGYRDPKAGMVRIKKSRAMDENLKLMFAFAAPGWTYSLDEIAECMGCTKERVRQIQDSALRKLRRRTNDLKKELRKQ